MCPGLRLTTAQGDKAKDDEMGGAYFAQCRAETGAVL